MTKPLSEEKLKQWRNGNHLGALVPFVPVAPAKTSADPDKENSGISMCPSLTLDRACVVNYRDESGEHACADVSNRHLRNRRRVPFGPTVPTSFRTFMRLPVNDNGTSSCRLHVDYVGNSPVQMRLFD